MQLQSFQIVILILSQWLGCGLWCSAHSWLRGSCKELIWHRSRRNMLKGKHPILSLYFLYGDVYYGIVLFHSDQSGGLPLHGDSAMLLHLPQGDPSTGSWRSSGKKALWKICESADHLVRKAKRGFVLKPWWTKLGQCLMWKVPGKRTRWALLAEGTHSTSLHQVSTR